MGADSDRVVFGDAIPSLTRWGRSLDADLVYRALLVQGSGSATDLQRSLGLSRRRVVVALDELIAIDAIRRTVDIDRWGPVWSPRPSAAVLESLRRGRHSRKASTATAMGALGPVNVVPHSSLELGDGVRHLQSRAVTRNRLAELATIVRHEHLAMNTETVFDPQSARSALPVDREVLRRGVRMRVLGTHDPYDPLAEHGRRPNEPHPEYRQAQPVPMKLIVIDRKVAFFPVAPRDFDRGYLEVSQGPVVAALVSLFEERWDGAHTSRESPMPRIALNARERALVVLLAEGHTDATAANHLRISPRTVSSTVRALMDRLGVDNRFQLGLTLGAAQVLPPVPPPPRTHEE